MSSKTPTHSTDKTGSNQRPSKSADKRLDVKPQLPRLADFIQPDALENVSLTPANVLYLQRTLGNQATNRLLAVRTQPRAVIQAKLTVGPAHDAYEQEADGVAEQVLTMAAPASQQPAASGDQPVLQRVAEEDEVQMKPLAASITPLVQRAAEDEDELQAKPIVQRAEEELQAKPEVQRASSGVGFEVGGEFERQLAASRGGGSPLPAQVRAFMEPRFGADFGGVRLHTGSESAQLSRKVSAQAFTLGQDIYLGEGKTDLESNQGKQLLAHELTHVVQQTGTVQRLWNKKKFQTVTKEGVFDRRGKTIKSIEELIAEYGRLNPYSTKDLKSAQDLVVEIKEHTENWIIDHSDDTSRSQRLVGMKAFLIHLNEEEIPKLTKVESQIRDKSNTTAGTLAIDDSRREGNLKIIRDNYTGSAKSMLTKVGWMIDASVPNPGDKSKLDIEVKIPVDPSGTGFVGMHLMCQSERKKVKELNTRCELTVTGGAKFGGLAELKAELGGYFEAQAADSDQVMKIISYALYRRFVESKGLPVEMSNFMWGGSTSSVGYKRAERWGANVEKEIFDKDSKAYVETGLVMGGTAQGGIKDVGGVGLSGKVAVKGSVGTRYDKSSILEGKQRLLGPSGGLGSTYTYSRRGDAQKSIGRSVYLLEPSFEGQVGMFKVNGKLKFVWLGDPKKEKRASIDEFQGEIGGAVTLPIHQGVLGGAPALLAGYVNTLAQSYRKASVEQAGKNGQALGQALGIGEDMTIAGIQLAQVPSTQFVAFPKGKSLNDQMGLSGSKAEMALKISAKYKWKAPSDPSKSGVNSLEIFLDYVKTGSLQYVTKLLAAQQNAVDMFSLKQETTSRLLTLKWETGKDFAVNPELD